MPRRSEGLSAGLAERYDEAMVVLLEHEPPEGYHLAFSGGKDSIVLKALADDAMVRYDAHYNVTTIDPPEVTAFIREHHPDVVWDRPSRSFFRWMQTQGFPLRHKRWCCRKLKERKAPGRTVLLGLRHEESFGRSGKEVVDTRGDEVHVHPILEWSSDEVWEFIRARGLPYPSPYDEGFHRLGCLFCPFKSQAVRDAEAARYPKFVRAFERAFVRAWTRGQERGLKGFARWRSGEEMFAWWMQRDEKLPPIIQPEPRVLPPVKRRVLTSVVSYPDRGPWGDHAFRGNCSGHLLVDLCCYFAPACVMDPMEGSGTTRDVCADLGIDYTGFDLSNGEDQNVFKQPWQPERFDLVFCHPPYADMIPYGEEPPCLSTLKPAQFGKVLVKLAELLLTHAVAEGGHLAILVGSLRRGGRIWNFARDLIEWREPSEPEIIKVQHHVTSSATRTGMMYGNPFIPIVDERVLIWRK